MSQSKHTALHLLDILGGIDAVLEQLLSSNTHIPITTKQLTKFQEMISTEVAKDGIITTNEGISVLEMNSCMTVVCSNIEV